MSWGEVKKINSDLSTPLNLAALINHIDLVGSNYVGYGDVDGTVALLATDAVYAHEIAKITLVNVVKDNNSVATAVTESPMAFKNCISDASVWEIVSQNSILPSHCETKLAATSGVGEWLAFIADIDNATLIACDTMNAVVASETAMNIIAASETAMTAVIASETAINAIIASETAMNAVVVSETAMTAIVTSETAISEIITNDQWLYSIAVNNDDSLGLSKLASGVEGMATTAWENNTKWGTIKSALDASSLFTKSGLLTDTGGTKTRTGNLITLIESAYSANYSNSRAGITPRYAGCYAHGHAQNWSTGKHIMWGGHSSTHDPGAPDYYCSVRHYMYTPII